MRIHSITSSNNQSPLPRRGVANVLTFICAILLLPLIASAGTHTWTGGATDGYWASAANWQNNNPPVLGESPLTLVFPDGPTDRDATNNFIGLVVDTLTLDGPSYYLAAYQGRGITLDAATVMVRGGTHYIREGFPFTLSGACSFSVATNSTLFARCPMNGSGGFTKFGDGSLYIDGNAANTYTGTTTVYDGRVTFGASHQSGGQEVADVTVPGALIIGPAYDAANIAPEVRLSFSEQIANNAVVTVNPKGRLVLNGFNEHIGTLAVSGGQVDSGVGTLEVNGDVTAIAPYLGVNTASIAGQLHLGNLPRNFNVGPGLALTVSARIRGGNFGNVYAGINKSGIGQLLLSGANTFTGLVAVVEGSIDVQHPQGLGATNGYTAVGTNATLSIGAGAGTAFAGELLSLNGGGRFRAVGDATWDGPVTLGGPAIIDVPNTNHTLTVSGVMSGPGGFQKTGKGELLLTGLGDNTYTGTTFVNAGKLLLNRTWVFGPYISINGPLIIGTDSANDPLTYVKLLSNQQIATNAPVTVRASGRLLFQDHSQALSAITINSGRIDTGANGMLQLEGSITSTNGLAGDALIEGQVDLGTESRAFRVEGYPMNLAAHVTGSYGGRLVKLGSGQLRLTAVNWYFGETVVMAGRLSVEDSMALGSLNSGWGASVSNGATLLLLGGIELPAEKSLTIEGLGVDGTEGAIRSIGLNTVLGDIYVNGTTRLDIVGSNGRLTARQAFNSSLGATLIKGGAGTLMLQPEGQGLISGHQGDTVIESGELILDWFRNNLPSPALRGALRVGGPLGSPNATVSAVRGGQWSDTSHVDVQRTGRINLAANTKSYCDHLTGTGIVDFATDAFFHIGPMTDGEDAEYAGTLQGGDVDKMNLQKIGMGRFIFSGVNILKGTTRVYGGGLLVNSLQQAARFQVENNSVLGGTGMVGNANILTGRIAPGVTVGRLRISTCTVTTSSQLVIDLNGPTPGTGYDLVEFDNQPDLSKSALQVQFGNGFVPGIGQQFTILRNHSALPTLGTFQGLPDGMIWRPVPSVRLRINYNGGDGNDVILTAVEPPAPSQVSSVIYNAGLPAIITGTGLPGDTYDVEANSDLGDKSGWSFLGTITAAANGTMHFIDNDAPDYPHRFYRFVLR